jgi:hypothetical protein
VTRASDAAPVTFAERRIIGSVKVKIRFHERQPVVINLATVAERRRARERSRA